MLAPSLGDEVEQGVNVGEGEPSGSLFVRHGRSKSFDVFGRG